MKDFHPISRTLIATILVWQAVCPAAQKEANVLAVETEGRKTRTELLNELRLKNAQVNLEHAKQAYDRYELDLEMLVTSAQTFSMALTNMPPQINCFFVEGASRITSVRFSQEVSKRNLILRASVPQRLDASMIDQRIDFQAWIARPERLDTIHELKRRYELQPIPREELEVIDAVRLDLTLIPKGTGRMEIQINNLYMEIEPETDVNIKATIHNNGTLTLFDIVPAVSPPLDWDVAVEPKLIERLAPNDKVEVKIHLTPGREAGVGEYETQIEARGQSGSEVVEALEKRFKVRIKTATNTKTILVLVSTLHT